MTCIFGQINSWITNINSVTEENQVAKKSWLSRAEFGKAVLYLKYGTDMNGAECNILKDRIKRFF
ncbi:hypothetical protein BpHYR1_044086 [Brachionus plicatilis]|uniref:Uncharacterized protein n=1 Tax=Brachionus plicatilis TaxID=10195 RepID=A0A3M7PW03_BRAPC|nr:hypothetical protein BpHYR1_044086 [Brachionus plicatilis]